MGEDIELIENLEYSKKLSIEISEKVEIAKVTEKMINTSSEFYRPSAIRGALIFFLMNELYKMSSFYMYSLESYVDVIIRAIKLVAEEMGVLVQPKKEGGNKKKKNEEGEEGEEGEEEKKEGEEGGGEERRRGRRRRKKRRRGRGRRR